MSSPFLGEIRIVGFNFAPRGWAFCSGQFLSIAQNTALFALLGTQYGGNGQTTYALPDLRGRMPVHRGQGPGLSPYVIGQSAGVENVTLLSSQMPVHTHSLDVSGDRADRSNADGNFLAVPADPAYAAVPATGTQPIGTAITGGGSSHNNMQPFLAMNFIIALQGIFPSRN